MKEVLEGLTAQLSRHLFWDVDPGTLDPEKDDVFIIRRVLELGILNDWRRLIAHYGLERIAAVAVGIRDLDRKAAAFIAVLANLDESDFACCNGRQLTDRHWIS